MPRAHMQDTAEHQNDNSSQFDCISSGRHEPAGLAGTQHQPQQQMTEHQHAFSLLFDNDDQEFLLKVSCI